MRVLGHTILATDKRWLQVSWYWGGMVALPFFIQEKREMSKNEIEKQGYSVPDISEFHVGFEYEYRWGENRWSKQVYSEGNSKPMMIWHLDAGNIRAEIKEKVS